MSGGELRELVAFESRVIESDGFGNDVSGDFVEQFRVPARLWPQTGGGRASFGGEAVMAARLTGQQPLVIRVRMSSQTRQITPAWRARDARRGTLYDIRSVINKDEQGAYLDILAQSGVATG